MTDTPNPEIFHNLLMSQHLHHTEGPKALDNLNKISNSIGYRRGGKAFDSSFENFLQDNPGCVEAIHAWMGENFTEDQLKALGWKPEEEEA